MGEFKKGDIVDIVDEVICYGGKPIRGVVDCVMDMMKGSHFPVHSKRVAYRVAVKGQILSFWLTGDRIRKAV